MAGLLLTTATQAFGRILRTGRSLGMPSGTGWRATTLVEFALVAPLFVYALVGILEGGRAMGTYISVVNAARDGARAAAIPSATDSQVRSAALNTSPFLAGAATVSISPSGSRAPNQAVTVTVTVNFTWMPLIGAIVGNTITMSSSATVYTEGP